MSVEVRIERFTAKDNGELLPEAGHPPASLTVDTASYQQEHLYLQAHYPHDLALVKALDGADVVKATWGGQSEFFRVRSRGQIINRPNRPLVVDLVPLNTSA